MIAVSQASVDDKGAVWNNKAHKCGGINERGRCSVELCVYRHSGGVHKLLPRAFRLLRNR